MLLWAAVALAAAEDPAELVRHELEQQFRTTAGAPVLKQQPITQDDARTIVRQRISAGLLRSMRDAAGTEFRLVPPGEDAELQVSILVLSYPDGRTARNRACRLKNRSGYFTGTKILTPYSYGVTGNRLVILFTENAGHEAVVQFVADLPHRLAQISN